MRAAVYHGRGDVRIEEVAAPASRLEHGQVLLQPLFAGICGTDVHEFLHGPNLIPTQPHPLTGAKLPQILGHEFSARVSAVGTGADAVSIGDVVAVRPGIWCGKCRTCLRGFQTSCPAFAALGLGHPWGGLAEFCLADVGQLTVVPPNVSALQAALLEPTGVAVHAFEQAGVSAGGRLLVTGGGPIGTLVALYAHAAGVTNIVVSEPNPRRRGLLEKLGVATVVDPRESSDMLADGVDGCVEASGVQPGLALCVESVLPGGTVVQAGLHGSDPRVAMSTLNQKQARLIGSWCWPVVGWDRTARLIGAGLLPVEELVSAVIELDDLVSSGIEALADPTGTHQKILVRIGNA